VLAALAAVLAALAAVFAAFVLFAAVLFAVGVSPQAIPNAPNARTDESAITFFIT